MSMSHLFLKSCYIRTPSQNGVGRYVCQLQRIVFKFCKSSGSSRGMRDYVESELVNFAKENPGIVVYLKPRRHRTAVIKAEFLNGDVQWLSCRNFSKEEIMKWVNLFRTQSRSTTGIRLLQLNHTDYPSIQGPWTPYTFRDPALNLVEYPNEEYSQKEQLEPSNSEILIEMFKKQQIQDNLDDKTAE